MRGLLELMAFGGTALVLHLALWPQDETQGVESSGGGGADLATVAASSASIAQQVAEWERPPEPVAPAEIAPPPVVEPPPEALPELAMPEAPRPVPDRPALPRLAAPTPPDTELAAPEPPPRPPEPEVKTDPAPEVRQAEADTPRPAERPDQKPDPAPAPPQRAQAQASQSSVAQQAQRAAGAGGEARGQAGQASAATRDPGRIASMMAEWGASIRARIQRRVPEGAGRGAALVELTVSAQGALVAVRVVRSSGNARLDGLALAAVRQAGRFPAAPAALGPGARSFSLEVRSR
ncbi:hypothetical protein BYZ73_16475 [Rhodovulum viride]|uniref:TonB C-terminal domain-containing protein n=1 Tax=Rhodovulum viride TaxID=1231134 RepID=A0ABX9DD49_9RHOB|nr:TonB family protein [Rhodovulum viride]RAP40257.1 hypothetical protein BYZ73_16475 [Rhodovulum viride]